MSANESVKVAIRWRPLIKREGDETLKVRFSAFFQMENFRIYLCTLSERS